MMEGSHGAEGRNRLLKQYVVVPWVSQFPHTFATSQTCSGNGFLLSFDKIISPSARQAT